MPSLAASLRLLAACLVGAFAFPQYRPRGDNSTGPDPVRAAAVKEAFDFAWNGYYTYAFPHDELHPVSWGYGDSRNSWGASAVDALSTALIMRNREVANQILTYIPTIDFTTTNTSVSLFETTIRYLGGMLSAYDLLTGPLRELADNPSDVDALLSQAVVLADSLKFAFDTPSGVPANNLNFYDQSTDGSPTNGLATIGTLVLEWTHLSDLTGDDEYARLAQTAEAYLLRPQPAWNEPWPGLVGTNVRLSDGLFVDASGGWVGGVDSFYEYLIKMWLYDTERFSEYRDRWILAVESTMAYLTSHPSSRPDLTFVAQYQNHSLILRSQHLACFDGGNFILGGAALGEQSYIDYGLELVAGCRETYAATATGIGPEQFSWDTAGLSNASAGFYAEHGFYPTDASYDLRPEVLESFYHAWRHTREPRYREWAWEAFVAVNASARRGTGFSVIDNVNAPDGGSATGDNQESFLFAETLKYAYLAFAEEEEWQVWGGEGGSNEWVYNTEAHPFRVAGKAV
ncbi:glycoside hydrolase family 47 protein [Aplosporella prunicola CBS 121167]|uniref:alpha-1,2-Mannosidase n=1 Tax=Aplosporella prunicola CBS 121167 TaxID=1176127 RepID=A0A6A6B0B8_9PEZI|nr:glycoside hydrolase family 47 protein [Aplosporella prunicola CBS 121167]KAF2136151.1 glycoside hydrolase family 47 protein [Aplosporella prunicola CBS 121167]